MEAIDVGDILGVNYIYGRFSLDPRIAKFFLDRDGVIARKDEDGAALFTVFKYARNAEEARELPKMLRALQAELHSLETDLDQFIDDFDFTKSPEEGSST